MNAAPEAILRQQVEQGIEAFRRGECTGEFQAPGITFGELYAVQVSPELAAPPHR